MLAADQAVARAASLLLVFSDEQLKALGRLDLVALEVPIDALDRLAQLPLAIGLHQAADGDLGRAGIGVTGRE